MSSLTNWNRGAVVAAGVLVISACSNEPSGEDLYRQPLSDGNTFACATCHALAEPAPDGLIRPGHPIGDAAARPAFKNGELGSLLEAVNVCRTEWMNAPAWTSDDSDWLKLEEFLAAQAPPTPAPTVDIQIVNPPAELGGGDAMRGRELFNGRCIVCHGEDAVGTERAPVLAGLGLETEYIAQRVRTSGREDSIVYDDLTGGRMPFWGADRLSDAELRDVVAWVSTSPPPSQSQGGGDQTPLRECTSTHEKIGYTAVLETRFHGVSGQAVIVDDCTIRLEMFNFDGTGIDVRAYGAATIPALGAAGFAFGPDLRRPGGYENETVLVQLEEGQSLDDLGAISIWCVPVGQSFGDGVFVAP